MLQIVIIFAWLLAIGCMLYLVKEMIKGRLQARRQRKLAIRSAIRSYRRQQFIENRRRLMQRSGGVVLSAPNEAAADRPQVQRLFGWIVLFLWEGYWVVEIVDQFSRSSRPLQLPYVFLFIVMVAMPYGVYLISRRAIRRPSEL
ncbi:MAG: hypothetical protein ACM3IH_06405 [Sphingobacteriales bacterium]